MNEEDLFVSQDKVESFKERGYLSEDILPKTKEDRTMNKGNYFTLWMGSVHNIPNYTAVGGFLALGLAPLHVIIAIILAGAAISVFMTYNGRAGSKYGIPFSMHLRSVFGNVGAKLPGFLRGVVAAIAWFGVQNYAGSQALLILVGKAWPAFLDIGGDTSILGLSVPAMISFVVFFLVNIAIGLGGGEVLNKFTAFISPFIYIVFGGMVIWGLRAAGGFGPILNYATTATSQVNPIFAYLIIIGSSIAVWAAPGVSVADFTQNAESTEDQVIGQTGSLMVAYTMYAFAAVIILTVGSMQGINHDGAILDIINTWDSTFSIFAASFVLLATTVSTNATGNIIPAAYQLTALFPKYVDYRKGVLIASVISFVIMPWKFMQSGGLFLTFLNLIGALLGPVAGVMIAHFYFIAKQEIDIDELYVDLDQKDDSNYRGINYNGYIALIVGFLVTVSGEVIPALAVLSQVGWITGFIIGFVLYLIMNKIRPVDRYTVDFESK